MPPPSITEHLPVPHCDKGLTKLRHHLCPCDQEALNCKAVVKVHFDGRRPTVKDAEGAPEAGGKAD